MSKVMKLKHPIQFGSETITELTFRRPKGKDIRPLRDPENLTAGDALDLLGRLCGQPKPVMDELDMEDFEEASEILEGFLQSGPKTGGAPTR